MAAFTRRTNAEGPRAAGPTPQRRTKLALTAATVIFLAGAGITGYLLWPRPPQTRSALSGPASAPTAQPEAHRVQVVLPATGLDSPDGVAVDAAGNLYVTAGGNDRVVKLAAATGTQAELPFTDLHLPIGVAVDGAGNLYVTTDIVCLRQYCPGNGRVLKLAAGSDIPTDLPFTGLNEPHGVAVDGAGNLYVTDRGRQVVKLAAGSSTQSVMPFTGLDLPSGVAVDVAGNLYVADAGIVNGRVVKLATDSGTQTVLPFTGLKFPQGVAVDRAGDVYVADTDNNRVLELAAASGNQTVLPFVGLSSPWGVAVDSAGSVYVTDNGNRRVLKLPAG